MTPLFTFTVCGEDPTRKYTDPNYEEPERTSKSKTGDDDAVEERSRVRDDSTSAEEKESEDASGAGASNNMHLELRSSHEENDSHEDQHELKKESANDAAVGAGERPFEQGMKPPESSELTDRSLYGADGAKPKLSPISKDSRAETDSGESESSTKANGKSPLVSTYKPPSKDFQPHEGAVRDKSAKFAAMAEIEFIETRHRRSVVDDSDVDTFQLFAEFVYSGTYTDPGVKQTMDDNRKNIQTSVPARPRRTKRETRTYGRGSYMRGLHGIGRPRGGGRIRGRGRGAFANTFGGMGFAMTGGPGQDPAASSGDEAAAVAENKEAVAAIDADPNPFAGRDEYNAWYETGAIGYLR